MDMPRTARIAVRFASDDVAGPDPACVLGALAPDIDDGPHGTSVESHADRDGIHLIIRAGDTSSFRAALNAHLRSLALAWDVAAKARGPGADHGP